MSHYSVAVITKTDKIDELQKLLAPFNEHIVVEPYISQTKEEIIAYAKNLQIKYKNQMNNIDPELAKAKTDEDFYKYMYSEYINYDEDGNALSTYNPNSKWDEYCIGGRFSYQLKRINSSTKYNQLQLKYIDFTDFLTYAILTPNGQWLEPSEMGYWGISHATKEELDEWNKNYKYNYDYINPDYYVTIVDCHI